MPCYQPRLAWKVHGISKLFLGNTPPRNHKDNAHSIQVACNRCIGCQQRRAREWAFRCEHELPYHASSIFTTLTLEDTNIHPTLSVELAQNFLKRLREHHERKGGPRGRPAPDIHLRHFLTGEYGELTKRPHYHAIIFGANADIHGPIIQEIWGLGFTTTYPATPATIAYTAGYVAKKANYLCDRGLQQHINPETGELYDYQPNFSIMSRANGIGYRERKHTNSWRLRAIYDGHEIPVPRYYHQAWKDATTPIDWRILEHQKQQERIQREKSGNYTQQRIDAARAIAESKLTESLRKRRKYA